MATLSMTSFGLTGDRVIDSITNGYKWSLDTSRTVDFSISNGFAGEYWYRPGELAINITAILELCSYYSNIRFNYLGYFSTPSIAAANGSEINVSLDGVGRFFSSYTQWAIGFFPNSAYNTTRYSGAPGDIFINVNSGANSLPSYAPGSQGWFLFLHEIGHTLGLKHPHDDGGTGRPTFSNLGLGALNQDWATAMSYNDDGAWNSFSWDPATPMLLDVIGLMYLYGINQSTNAGNSTFRLTESNTYLSLWDASGMDTLDASSALSGWTIVMPDKTVSNLVDVKVGFALPTSQLFSSVPTTLSWIIGDYELAVGSSYDDEILGNSFNNQISGGFGNDEILGGLGDDSIDGGPGIDTAFFQSFFSSAQISYSSSTGRYSVKTTEGTDSLKDIEYFQFSDRVLKSSESITVALPSYSLVAQGANTVDEGQSAVFTLLTTSVATGTSVAYSITGVSAADIVSGSLSGSVTVGSNGQATISVPVFADNLTEGNETLTVTAQGQSASILVNDTSLTLAVSPTIAITSNVTSLSAGQTALVNFFLSRPSTDFTATDITVSGGTLSNFSGSGTTYTATFEPYPMATSGTISVASGVFSDANGSLNKDGSDVDNQISLTNTHWAIGGTIRSLTASATSYEEGQSAQFTIDATGYPAGTPISWSVSFNAMSIHERSFQLEDILGKAGGAGVRGVDDRGVATLDANGKATFVIPIALDALVEGTEQMGILVQVPYQMSVRNLWVDIKDKPSASSTVPLASLATKSYSVAFTQASVRSSDGGATWTVTTPSGVETLAAPDRLRFSDKTIALDFDRGEAGHKTVTMIGAAFGKGFINQYFGTGVSLFDSGQSMAQIAQLVVSTGLIESMVGSSNSAWVRHVYKNVTGANPDAFTEAVYRTYLDNGTYTRAGLLELAAGVSALESQINLVGIRAEGIEYVPFI